MKKNALTMNTDRVMSLADSVREARASIGSDKRSSPRSFFEIGVHALCLA